MRSSASARTTPVTSSSMRRCPPGGIGVLGTTRHTLRDTSLTVQLAPSRHAPRTSETGRGHTGQRLVECCLDLQLHVIRELGARSREELDSVVVVGVVRRGNDDPGAQAQGSGKVRDGWCGHRPDETDIDTGCRQTCLQRRFHHVAGNPGVLSNQDRRTLSRLDVTTRIVLCGENSARCVTQTHDEIGCYRDVSDATTHAVGTKILS